MLPLDEPGTALLPIKPNGRGWSLTETQERIAAVLTALASGQEGHLAALRRRELLGVWAVRYHLLNVGSTRALVMQADVAKAVARLRENGDDIAELLHASDAMRDDPFHNGDNDRGKKYLSPSLLFRNREKLLNHAEKYAGDREHPALLGQTFDQMMGLPPLAYLTSHRMQVAGRRLLQSGASVAEVLRVEAGVPSDGCTKG